MSTRRRGAAVPPAAGYSRPQSVASDGLRVTVKAEDGKTKVFDFGSISAPTGVVVPLTAVFAKASGPAGSWRQMSTAQSGWETLKRFLLFVASEHLHVTEVEHLTKDVWKDWCAKTETAGGRNKPASMMRTLLREVEGLPGDMQMALKGRVETSGSSQVVAYSRDEVARIVKEARRVFRTAEARITANVKALERYRAGLEPQDAARARRHRREWSHGEVLDSLSRTGRMPPSFKSVPASCSAPLREALGMAEAGVTYYRPALFLTVHEAYAAAALLVDAEALNLSVMARLKVSDITPHRGPKQGQTIYQVDTDKPRRGPDRFPPVTFAGPSARLLERILAVTQPARDTLNALGFAEDPLLVACNKTSIKSRHPSGVFITDWMDAHGAAAAFHKRVPVHDKHGKPIEVTLQRMRKSMVVIRGEALGHSLEMSVNGYRGPDPQTHTAARPVVMQGLRDAVDDAKRRVAARVSPSETEAARTDPTALAARLGVSETDVEALLEGQLDTATAACLDIMHSPHDDDAGGPCTASFLMCVQCPNAVATPAHIPRIVATRAALAAAARSNSPAVRQRYYAQHVAAFDDLLSQIPEPELRRARATVTATDIERVTHLLNRSLDT